MRRETRASGLPRFASEKYCIKMYVPAAARSPVTRARHCSFLNKIR